MGEGSLDAFRVAAWSAEPPKEIVLPLSGLREIWGELPPEIDELPDDTLVSVGQEGVHVITD